MESSLFSSWKKKISNTAVKAWKMTNIHRSKIIAGFAVVCTLVLVAFVGHGYVQGQLNTVYHVKVDGKTVGTVSDKEMVDTWVSQKRYQMESQNAQASIELDNTVSYEEEKGFKLSYNNESVLSKLDNIVSFSATAVELKIDGKVVGIVKDEDTINALLDQIKSQYAPADKKDAGVRVASVSASAVATTTANEGQLKETSFVENVELKHIKVNPSDVITADQLASLLQKSAVEEKVYHVVEGDCVGCIASKFDMSTNQLLALNPGLTEETLLQLNQEIKVSAAKPSLTVKTVETVKYNQDIPFLTQYVEDANLPKGQSKTVQEGKNGQKEIEAQIVKENGIEVSRTVLNQKVLAEPTVKIVKNGTKNVSRGSGTFAWPAMGGQITSGFGKRWGKAHVGLDIAGVKNRSIKAADNGKIVFAGWENGYGNCIIIDHGNGFKTRYGHLKSISKKSGTVEKGEVIGIMGSTGDSTGVHLHFEIIKNGSPVNPSKYL